MQADDPTTFETTLADGRRMTLSLPPTNAGWGADGIRALRPVPPTHTGRGQEPPALPTRPALPLEVALLGLGA
ncbi:hypothetical protein [Streptomyces sp. SP18CS02]|uniref:hypothetical protein n=1 Tax=Streptomyces sp. SP18CS02 TaxID=3002531 RepID=UPI002E7A6748|nr:hypothetical protein [Streptomyces sp. SP18CS02]MEE1752931.1 hypothetical protein [Streptomyces sp. SP18CS02]